MLTLRHTQTHHSRHTHPQTPTHTHANIPKHTGTETHPEPLTYAHTETTRHTHSNTPQDPLRYTQTHALRHTTLRRAHSAIDTSRHTQTHSLKHSRYIFRHTQTHSRHSQTLTYLFIQAHICAWHHTWTRKDTDIHSRHILADTLTHRYTQTHKLPHVLPGAPRGPSWCAQILGGFILLHLGSVCGHHRASSPPPLGLSMPAAVTLLPHAALLGTGCLLYSTPCLVVQSSSHGVLASSPSLPSVCLPLLSRRSCTTRMHGCLQPTQARPPRYVPPLHVGQMVNH